MVRVAAHIEEALSSPTAWFAVLERAKLDGNYQRAAEALERLRQLGVEVRFNPKRRPQKAPRHSPALTGAAT